jgi:hypothetical protein
MCAMCGGKKIELKNLCGGKKIKNEALAGCSKLCRLLFMYYKNIGSRHKSFKFAGC